MSSWSSSESLLDCLGPVAPPLNFSDQQWQLLLDDADRRRLLPMLYPRIGQAAPPQPRDRLRRAYLATGARNMHLYAQLEQILASLNAQHIDIIVLKGACLAREIYSDIALRPMGDIDLLAQSADLPKILDCLASVGYASSSRDTIEQQFAACHHLEALTRGGEFPIELHHHIELPNSPFTVDVAGLWQRRRFIKVGDCNASMLGAEDLVLHLCLHAVRHARRDWYDNYAMKSVCDITQTTRALAVNWDLLVNRAISWRAERPIFLVLTLARQWLGADIPTEPLESLRPADFRPQVIDWAREQFLSPIQSVEPIGIHAARMLGSETPQKRLAILLKRFFPPLHEIRGQYGLPPDSPWVWACYPLRFSQLLVRDAPAIWRYWRGDLRMGAAARHAANTQKFRQWLTGSSSHPDDRHRRDTAGTVD